MCTLWDGVYVAKQNEMEMTQFEVSVFIATRDSCDGCISSKNSLTVSAIGSGILNLQHSHIILKVPLQPDNFVMYLLMIVKSSWAVYERNFEGIMYTQLMHARSLLCSGIKA